MKKRWIRSIFVPVLIISCCFVFYFSSASAENVTNDTLYQLDEEIQKALKIYKTAGASVLVAKDGEIIYSLNYGYSDKRHDMPITDTTYYKIASVSKMVTSIRVMQLVEEGLLQLDTDISEYLGYTVQNPYQTNTPITLRMLMSHTSSLNEEGGYSNQSNGLRYLISTDKNQRANYYNWTPGSKYSYSNFGAGIMGSLIEAVTGENLNDQVYQHVFAPFGIDAAYSATLLQNEDDISYQYRPDGETAQVARSAALKKEWDAGVDPDSHFRICVGSVWIRAKDLCTLSMMLCNGGEYNCIRLLQKETVEEMLSSQKDKGGVTVDSPYGLCVNRVTNLVDGHLFYGHQGINTGCLCNVYFDPDTQFVFVLVSNGCYNKMGDHIALVTRRIFTAVYEAFYP